MLSSLYGARSRESDKVYLCVTLYILLHAVDTYHLLRAYLERLCIRSERECKPRLYGALLPRMRGAFLLTMSGAH